jgi:RHS repeat-associated protein
VVSPSNPAEGYLVHNKLVFGGTSTTTTTFIGSLYEETNNRGSKHIYLGDMKVASVTGGRVRYHHADHLGGANVLSNSDGNKVELIEYEPFGKFSRNEKYGNTEDVARFYFTGQRYDEDTELYYYNARYYDPGLGRFISADTIVQAPDNPQTLNRYAYAGNNPVNNVDPSGHSFWKKVGNFFKKFGDLIFPGLGAAARGDIIGAGIQLLTFGTTIAASNMFLQASGVFSLYSAAIPPTGGQAAQNVGKVFGYAALATGVIGAGLEIIEKYNSFTNTTGEFYQVNQANPQASKVVAEAEILKQYGQNGAKILVNGINMDLNEALKMAVSHGADILFYNPTSGAYADLFESTLGTLMPTKGGMSTRLGKLLTQMRVDLVGNSQGSIIAANAMVYAGLNGGAVAGSTFVPFGKAVGMGRLAISSRMAGMTVVYGQGETKMFDIIRLVSSELNPLGYAQGAVGLVSGVGLKQHTSY